MRPQVWSGRCFFFSSRRRHTRFDCDWSSDVCSSDLYAAVVVGCATVAASPVSWTHHQVWTVLAGLLLVAGGGRARLTSGLALLVVMTRSEERRVREEGRSRWSPYH